MHNLSFNKGSLITAHDSDVFSKEVDTRAIISQESGAGHVAQATCLGAAESLTILLAKHDR